MFLAIHFDRYEVFVKDGSDLRVRKAFAFHDVAPVAGGIANLQKDWLVFSPRLLKSSVPPRVPVDWVIGMLKQVGAFLMDQMVWFSHALLCPSISSHKKESCAHTQ